MNIIQMTLNQIKIGMITKEDIKDEEVKAKVIEELLKED